MLCSRIILSGRNRTKRTAQTSGSNVAFVATHLCSYCIYLYSHPGMLKHWLRRQIVDGELVISKAEDVHVMLKNWFGSSEYLAAAEAKGNKICSFNITWLSEFERVVAGSLLVDTVRGHGRGVRKLFSFEAIDRGMLASRVFSCWCAACVSGKRVADGVNVSGCERKEQWQVQTIRSTTDHGVAAQRRACKKRALEFCNHLEAGAYYAMETVDRMQATGNANAVVFYVCRLMEWDDGTLVKYHNGKRTHTDGKYNKQQVDKGDPLVRVCYFPLDCTDPSSAVFLDSGSVSKASGLGFRHKLAAGSFTKQRAPEAAPAARRTRQAAASALIKAASTAPPWMRWDLRADEKVAIDSAILAE